MLHVGVSLRTKGLFLHHDYHPALTMILTNAPKITSPQSFAAQGNTQSPLFSRRPISSTPIRLSGLPPPFTTVSTNSMDNFFLFWLIRQLSAVHLVAICAIALVLGIGRFALTALSESSESSLDASSREQQIIQLHDKHGTCEVRSRFTHALSHSASVVRVAPGWYSISDPEAAAVLLTTIGSTSKVAMLIFNVWHGFSADKL